MNGMTNAQAALLAAAHIGDNDRATLAIAGDYLEWLNDRDADYIDTPAPAPVVQCGKKSPHGFACTHEVHAVGTMHRNDEEGVVWYDLVPSLPHYIEKPATVEAPARHFLPSPDANVTTCGLDLFTGNRWAGLKVSTAVKDVTCDRCKVELGL